MEHQEYPKYLFHPKDAPGGRLFQNAAETKGLKRKGWVESPALFPLPIRRGPIGLVDRYRRLTIWNKVGFWGAIASILGLGWVFLSPGAGQSASVSGDNATVMQAGRDVIIQSPPQRRELPPQQVRLLELVDAYQRKYAANRLIVSRTTGDISVDANGKPIEGANLMKDLFGEVSEHNAGRLNELILTVPGELLRLIPENLWDSPYVVTITEAGAAYVRPK
ncbi:MAG: hypothetical protein WC829_23055 [Hyphomicrobium sp.]|jgi:hypothetical protein